MNQLSTPITKSGLYRRKQSDLVANDTGRRYCTSCNQYKPTETVKIYRGNRNSGLPRCDDCQARRIAAREARK